MSGQDAISITKDDSPAIMPRLGRNSPILSYFCVYNPLLGQSEENTKDQILYYTAKKVVPADVKMKQVGLAQALVNFTSTFSPSHPTQNVHSQKNRMIFLQPEPGFWMHMCVELGILRKQIKDAKGKEKLVTEYLDSQLNDKALEAVLNIGYEQFKLLNGTFQSIMGDEKPPSRQRTRALMHAIEEFFSEWIWKWDFDRLDIMCFTAVFNGVPVQPVLRTNYLRVHELDQAIKAKFDQLVQHVFVLNQQDGSGLVYRSPTLHIKDICALRKYVVKKVEKQVQLEKRKSDIESIEKQQQKVKVSGLKAFTKSLSTSHILNYFSSSGSKSTETVSSTATTPTIASIESQNNAGLPAISDIPTAPSSPNITTKAENQGIFLSGLIETTAIGMNGEERPVTRSDLVRVYISSTTSGDLSDTLVSYYLIIYKHHKSKLVWNFLLPATSQSQDLISDPLFYTQLESFMSIEKKLYDLTQTLLTDMKTMQVKSLQLGKHYKCFYYDNATLNIKSTMMDSPTNQKEKGATTIQVTNDMLLQLLEVKQDFERIPPKRTSEVYTRSTSNHWIAGHRLYNTLRATEEEEEEVASRSSSSDHSKKMEQEENDDDYTEMYLIAAKKDTSLADVEETLGKMTKSLLDIMHIE